MIKSLRWRLQIWHAVVLTVVLVSFGVATYNLHWQTRLQQIDADLGHKAEVLQGQLRRFPLFPGRATGRMGPPSRTADSPQPRTTDGSARIMGDRVFGPPRLPDEILQLFEGPDARQAYFTVWGREGQVLGKSTSAPEIPYPGLHIDRDELRQRRVRNRQHYREIVLAPRPDLNIVVGRSMSDDVAAERRYGAWLFLVGSGVLVAGMLGGGWLADRIVRPIREMTTTAQSISGSNLTERIDLKETETELGQLAGVLNDTFDRLQSAFEQQSRFTADASHELRTPLSVILAHIELALSRDRTTEEYRKSLEICQRASTRMKTLMDDLLMLAQFDSGHRPLQTSEFELSSVVEECIELLKPLAEVRGIRLQIDVAPIRLRADKNRILQVFTNLVTNAIRYNRDGGTVRILGITADSAITIRVTDTGVGIPPEALPHLFERFYRVDKARSRTDGGSGLGLSICQTIVEAHGGTIHVMSELGVGTTVEVRLPVRG